MFRIYIILILYRIYKYSPAGVFIDVNYGHVYSPHSSHHDGSAMEKRFAATTRILDDMGFGCISLQAPEDGAPLDQMMALTHFLDMVSLELARLREVDPVGVPKISRLKRMLA